MRAERVAGAAARPGLRHLAAGLAGATPAFWPMKAAWAEPLGAAAPEAWSTVTLAGLGCAAFALLPVPLALVLRRQPGLAVLWGPLFAHVAFWGGAATLLAVRYGAALPALEAALLLPAAALALAGAAAVHGLRGGRPWPGARVALAFVPGWVLVEALAAAGSMGEGWPASVACWGLAAGSVGLVARRLSSGPDATSPMEARDPAAPRR